MNGSIVPAQTPAATRERVLSFITDKLPLPPFPFLVGRRGYYGDSMGEQGANDCNVYDDALWIVQEDSCVGFNANCDPGKHRPGMANLKVGRWRYRIGIHNQSKDPVTHPHYEALVQAAPVVVLRDDQGEDRGLFGINIHRGGHTVTSSEGCQTIPPEQWEQFIHDVKVAMSRYGAMELSYILTSRYA